MEYKKGFLLMDKPHWITPKILKGIKGDYAVGYNPVEDCDTIEVYEGDETIAFINLNPETDVICIRKDQSGRLFNQPYLQPLMKKIYKNFQTHFYIKLRYGFDPVKRLIYDSVMNVNVLTYDAEISMAFIDRKQNHVSILEFDSLKQFENELPETLVQYVDYSYWASDNIKKKLSMALKEKPIKIKYVKSLLKSLNTDPLYRSVDELCRGKASSLIHLEWFAHCSAPILYPFYMDRVKVPIFDTRCDFEKTIMNSISEHVPKDAVGVFIESYRLSGSYYTVTDLAK